MDLLLAEFLFISKMSKYAAHLPSSSMMPICDLLHTALRSAKDLREEMVKSHLR